MANDETDDDDDSDHRLQKLKQPHYLVPQDSGEYVQHNGNQRMVSEGDIHYNASQPQAQALEPRVKEQVASEGGLHYDETEQFVQPLQPQNEVQMAEYQQSIQQVPFSPENVSQEKDDFDDVNEEYVDEEESEEKDIVQMETATQRDTEGETESEDDLIDDEVPMIASKISAVPASPPPPPASALFVSSAASSSVDGMKPTKRTSVKQSSANADLQATLQFDNEEEDADVDEDDDIVKVVNEFSVDVEDDNLIIETHAAGNNEDIEIDHTMISEKTSMLSQDAENVMAELHANDIVKRKDNGKETGVNENAESKENENDIDDDSQSGDDSAIATDSSFSSQTEIIHGRRTTLMEDHDDNEMSDHENEDNPNVIIKF